MPAVPPVAMETKRSAAVAAESAAAAGAVFLAGLLAKEVVLTALPALSLYLVLARRVRLGNWNRFIDGDLAMLERSRSIFAADGDDDELRRRLDSLEIHPAGPMPGRETASGDESERLRLEAEVRTVFDKRHGPMEPSVLVR